MRHQDFLCLQTSLCVLYFRETLFLDGLLVNGMALKSLAYIHITFFREMENVLNVFMIFKNEKVRGNKQFRF